MQLVWNMLKHENLAKYCLHSNREKYFNYPVLINASVLSNTTQQCRKFHLSQERMAKIHQILIDEMEHSPNIQMLLAIENTSFVQVIIPSSTEYSTFEYCSGRDNIQSSSKCQSTRQNIQHSQMSTIRGINPQSMLSSHILPSHEISFAFMLFSNFSKFRVVLLLLKHLSPAQSQTI